MNQESAILIVDDQESAREVLRGLLNDQGYKLILAGSGEEALEKAAASVPDLVLLDVMMPGMDGFEVCRRLRADTILREVSVIMVTALDDSEARLKGLEAGVDDFITKPFNSAELRARVKTITHLNHQRRFHMHALRAERDRTQAILEALGEAVIVTDAEGVIQYLNPAAVALTGFTPEEALGHNWHLWQSEETESRLLDNILKQVQTGQTWRGQVINKRKNNTLYDAELTVAPLFAPDNNHRPMAFVTIQRDITPLKKAEQAKNEFVSNVSHELRTPLSVLTLISDNLDTLYDRLDDNQRHKMIRDIQKHTQILNELINDVLTISRIDSHRVSMKREPVDLAELAQIEVEEILPLAQQKSQKLQSCQTGKLIVSGHPTQLRQMIRNLLNNAIKYTPEEGHIFCECARISPSFIEQNLAQAKDWPDCANLPGGTWAALRVVDTGIGIDEEHLPHLFNRFYRVKTEQKIRGTGLGLAIAKKLIELHDGHIGVASIPHKGSTFAIYLPLLK